jgi:3-carboxy-cis,cis-muconate cycloisomerase
MGDVIAGLEVDSRRMSANMAITRGQIFAESVQTALAPVLGRGTAHKLVAELVKVAQKQGRDLSAVIASDSRVTRSLSERVMRDLFDPSEYLGSTDAFIRAALEQWDSELSEPSDELESRATVSANGEHRLEPPRP